MSVFNIETDTSTGAFEEFEWASVLIDTTKHDGNPAIFLEGCIRASGGTATYELRVRGGSSAIATITQTTTSVPQRVRSADFWASLTAGATQYAIFADCTTTDRGRTNKMVCLVTHDATCTAFEGTIAIAGNGSTFTNTTYGDAPADRRPLYLYESAKWGTTVSWYLDVYLNNSTNGQDVLCQLLDASDTQIGEVTVNGQGDALQFDRAVSAALTLTNNSNHRCQFRVTGGTGRTGAVVLRYEVTNYTLAIIPFLIATSIGDSQTGVRSNAETASTATNPTYTNLYGGRNLLDLSLFGGTIVGVYFESCAQSTTSDGNVQVGSLGTVDVAGTYTNVQTNNHTASTPQRVRSADIQASITNNNRYACRWNNGASAGTCDEIQAFILVEMSAPLLTRRDLARYAA